MERQSLAGRHAVGGGQECQRTGDFDGVAAIQGNYCARDCRNSSWSEGSGRQSFYASLVRDIRFEICRRRYSGSTLKRTMERILENKVAIITGANQGLGFEIARQYVEAGATLTICARNGKLLNQARTELLRLAGPNQQIRALTADVSQENDVKAVIEATLETFGRVDILVNNAGVYGPKGMVEEIDWQEWIRAIEINLYGSILMCRAVLPHFKMRGSGKIVQLSGGGATSPLPRLSAYAASKAAIIRFVETLAEEVREQGIDVNAIAPGPLNTRMLEEVLK